MSDLALLTARVTEIRSTLAAVASPLGGRASTTSGADFASTLASATGATASGSTGTTDAAVTSTAAVDGDAVVTDAKRYLGVAYQWGGTDPSSGLDCSGLVQRVFGDLGVDVPRTVHQQKTVGTAVASMAQARPGDLLVFGDHHIGIYVGGGQMLHAPKSGDVVKIAKVYDTPTSIRRVVPAGDGVPGVGVQDVGDLAAAASARPAALRPGASGYDQLFAAATQKYDLPSGLLRAVAQAESGFDAGARSSAGAVGLMQIMPGTARELGVDPADPAQAVDGAARLLKKHLETFGSVPLALAAYNAGPGAVRRYDGIPPYGETRAYVQRVTSAMQGVAA